MAKGRIPIKAAERLSDQYKCPMIVIYAIHDNGEEFTVTTYGKTKKMCRHIADIGRKISEAILNGSIAPEEVEPEDVPGKPMIFQSTKKVV